MGRSYTPTYRIEFRDSGGGWSREAWSGRATEKRLGEWVEKRNNSLKPGGVNEHVSRSLGYMPVTTKARIVRQRTNEVVAEWNAPKFMVI